MYVYVARSTLPEGVSQAQAQALAELFADALEGGTRSGLRARVHHGYTPVRGEEPFAYLDDAGLHVCVHAPDVRGVAPYVQAARNLHVPVSLTVLPVTFVEWLCRFHRPFWIDDEEHPAGVFGLPGGCEGRYASFPNSALPELQRGDAYRDFGRFSAPTDHCAGYESDPGWFVCNGACAHVTEVTP